MSNIKSFTPQQIQNAKNRYMNLRKKYEEGLTRSIFGGNTAKAKFSQNVAQPLNKQAQLLQNMGIKPYNVVPWSGTGMR